MCYYERLRTTDKQQLNSQDYFEQKIATNLFYGLGNEFAVYSYPIPKSNLGVRKYRFFTYPARVLYYAIGLYFLDLAYEFITSYYQDCQAIHSFYGGKLILNQNDRTLHVNFKAIWYKPHYQEFRESVKSALKGMVERKIVIKLDIQNYFDEVSIPNMLHLLDQFVKPSLKKELRFDGVTKGQLKAFFDYISYGKGGIPQTDNDVISSFLGYLYLVFGDLLLEGQIRQYGGSIINSPYAGGNDEVN
jgi:AbiA family abortive infection protein